MKLSVLISSTHARRYHHQRLLGQLREQSAQMPEHDVQIVVLLDDGECPHRHKTEALEIAAVHPTTILLEDSADLDSNFLFNEFQKMKDKAVAATPVKDGAKPAKK
jgi:hypothetical protein